jgi:hypothetical protein
LADVWSTGQDWKAVEDSKSSRELKIPTWTEAVGKNVENEINLRSTVEFRKVAVSLWGRLTRKEHLFSGYCFVVMSLAWPWNYKSRARKITDQDSLLDQTLIRIFWASFSPRLELGLLAFPCGVQSSKKRVHPGMSEIPARQKWGGSLLDPRLSPGKKAQIPSGM